MLITLSIQWSQVEHLVDNMALAGTRLQIGVKETGTSTTVPDNDRARLMYYLSCMYMQYVDVCACRLLYNLHNKYMV